jgi:2-polyprenyl-3-methyl-5-hydroxy-6-metoxy-1,4-benzoquinol methylase
MEPRVIRWRQATIEAARRPAVADRIDYLCSLAKGRRVLDIGVVDHTSDSDRAGRWLHGSLVDAAADILGLDILADEVELLRKRGYNVRCMDVTGAERPEGTFDLIVAGEVIEHLGSPHGLLQAGAELLAPGGRLVLSTPNPYAAWRVAQNLRGRPYENVDHALLLTAWGVAELAERAGLHLDSFRGVAVTPVGWKARLMDGLVRKRVIPLVRETTCESILYELVPSTRDLNQESAERR